MKAACDPGWLFLPAVLPIDGLAVRPGGRLTVGGLLHLAAVGVGHPRLLGLLGLVVPQLLLVHTGDLGHDELDILRDQLALLPRHRLTGVSPGPLLVGGDALA